MSIDDRNLALQVNLTGTFLASRTIAHAVLFLRSDQADYVTAQILTADGGLTKSALAQPASDRGGVPVWSDRTARRRNVL